MHRLYSYYTHSPDYNDRTFRLLISVPAAALMVLYREDDSIWYSLFDINFWVSGVFSYLISILLLWLIKKITMRLDEKYDWRRQTFLRTVLQLSWGLIFTVFITFFLATLFFLFFKTDIRDTDYIRTDLPVVVLLILLANLYYLSFYLWQIPPEGFVPIRLVEDVINSLPKNAINEEIAGNKLLFLAQTEEGIIPVMQETIAAVYRQNEYVLLKTFDRRTLNINQSINQVYKELDSFQFFQINPRFIVCYKICLKINKQNFGKRFLELAPPLDVTEEVTRSRVKDFEKWMRR